MLRSGVLLALILLTPPVQAADVISASFDVSLGGTRIMKADYLATIDDDGYSANLSARTVGVSKMFSKIKLNMSAKGGVTEVGVKPAAYTYSRKKNDKRKERNLTFAPNGSLITEGTNYEASILAALNDRVMDPMSILLKLGRSPKPCSGKHRVFDGRDVFDLTLSAEAKTANTLTCNMVYTPVAGNDVDDGNGDSVTYKITLAAFGDKISYTPVRIAGSTKGVGFEVSASSVTINGSPLSY
jgi:hypothetical protein